MGTSGAYTPSPKWSNLKTDVTNTLNSGAIDGVKAQALVSDFIQQLCGEPEEGFGKLPRDFGTATPAEALKELNTLLSALPKLPSRHIWSALASGGGGPPRSERTVGGRRGRKGGKTLGGTTVRPVARRLATFLSDVPKVGLRQALINAGVTSIDTLPPEKIALAVADVLAAEANLLVQAELRDALSMLMEEICAEPQTFQEAEQMFLQSAYNLQSVVQLLFECYIMERFKTFFCEHESKKHGYDAADKILKEARKFVSTEMQLEKAGRRDLTEVNWGGAEGGKIIDAILQRTIAVYCDI